MKKILLLDLDNTLTPPRLPIEREMVEVLSGLEIPFNIVAGSDLELLRSQFFLPLHSFRFNGQFGAFISNGAIHYHCDYTNHTVLKLISSFDMLSFLGNSDCLFLLSILEKVLVHREFQIPQGMVSDGRKIICRRSMINFCPIGRKTVENEKERNNRKNFIDFDLKTGYRRRVLEYLRVELDDLIQRKELSVTLGGQTSFDIGIQGKDKSWSVRKMLELGAEKITFIGDALYDGGNDFVIREFVENWSSESGKCPVDLIQVSSCEETKELLRNWGKR